MKCIFIVGLFLISSIAIGDDRTADGTVKTNALSEFSAWSKAKNQWISVDEFWALYAEKNAEKSEHQHWGTGQEYPPYEKVKEYDTFLVQVPSGTCLMEFFHSRWHRANDVNR